MPRPSRPRLLGREHGDHGRAGLGRPGRRRRRARGCGVGAGDRRPGEPGAGRGGERRRGDRDRLRNVAMRVMGRNLSSARVTPSGERRRPRSVADLTARVAGGLQIVHLAPRRRPSGGEARERARARRARRRSRGRRARSGGRPSASLRSALRERRVGLARAAGRSARRARRGGARAPSGSARSAGEAVGRRRPRARSASASASAAAASGGGCALLGGDEQAEARQPRGRRAALPMKAESGTASTRPRSAGLIQARSRQEIAPAATASRTPASMWRRWKRQSSGQGTRSAVARLRRSSRCRARSGSARPSSSAPAS